MKDTGFSYKRLDRAVGSGIYECNETYEQKLKMHAFEISRSYHFFLHIVANVAVLVITELRRSLVYGVCKYFTIKTKVGVFEL